jgi:Mg-chelatase subunit ChlD
VTHTRGLPIALSLSISEYFCLIAVALTLLLVALQAQLQDALARATRAEARIEELAPRAPEPAATRVDDALHARLIGLQGGFRRVVVVVDRSGSMKADHRWAEVRAIIATWLQHLPFQQVALVVFNDTVDTFPAAGGYLDLAAATNASLARQNLLRYLTGIEPAGNTDTLSALRRAYAYPDVDSIILFSDGYPDRGGNRFDRQMADAIYALCRSHGRHTPINVIGVGRYFDPRLGKFLMTVARLTGGTFIGR